MKKTNYYKRKSKAKSDTSNKDRIRNLIVDEIRKRDINSILTLESPDFKFSKLLPDKKIIVFEKEGNICEKLENKAPKNVEVVFGNINRFEVFNSKADCIYLDFCKTWETEQENIIKLKDSLRKSKLFILTLCMRSNLKLEERFKGDYQFDLLNKIQSLTELNWKVIYGESYCDSVQMITLILENGN